MLSIIADAMGIATRTNTHNSNTDYYNKGNISHYEQEEQRHKQVMRALDVARTRVHW